jgi:hypothetical protein
MAVKSLHQFFYYYSKYLNSMECQEISMSPSIRTILASFGITASNWRGASKQVQL